MGVLQSTQKMIRIVVRRLKTQGFRTTAVWAYARGVPKLSGIPIEKYSRITDTVFVGAQFRKAGKATLQQWGVNGVVNMRIEFDDATRDLTLQHYCYLPTIDDDPPTMAHLQQGVDFMQQVIDEGGKVYVHCAGGIGRAPTMAAAYFMSRGASLEEAIDLIKATRPFINIMPSQMDRLREFEKMVTA